MQSTMTKVAAVALLAAAATSAHAVSLNNGDSLTINAGTYTYDTNGNVSGFAGGSFFAMDNGDGKIVAAEKNAISQGTTGIVIGASNTALGAIDQGWLFNSNTGYHFVSTAITGGTSGLNFSGWTVNWNGGNIDMSSGAWAPSNANSGMPTSGYTNGVAQFTWDGVYGHAYSLNYTATVPSGGFAGVHYAFHADGIVNQAAPVPEASTYGMMLAGLGLVGFAVRRRKMVA